MYIDFLFFFKTVGLYVGYNIKVGQVNTVLYLYYCNHYLPQIRDFSKKKALSKMHINIFMLAKIQKFPVGIIKVKWV